jgi:hypothetical protein
LVPFAPEYRSGRASAIPITVVVVTVIIPAVMVVPWVVVAAMVVAVPPASGFSERSRHAGEPPIW